MSEEPEAVIIVFKDSVSKEEVEKNAEDVIANGGTVKDRYYESGLLNGFSASIPPQYLESFRGLQADKIKYIEGDGIVTTQAQ